MPLLVKKCKLCRKVGQKLLLNERCSSYKCALSRRKTKPGSHGDKPRATSIYARQLLEKQKLKFYYQVKERQLKTYVKIALKANEPAPQALMKLLERRLDNIIWLSGLVAGRTAARQLTSHGHFLVNGHRVDLPSYLVSAGDVISLREKSKNSPVFKQLSSRLDKFQPPAWLKLDPIKLQVEVSRLPEAEEIQTPFDFKLVIDFYSRY
jgi:small subunit ribosomal protein S4